MPPTPEEVRDWVGADVLDADGHDVGRLIGSYLDDTGRPLWLAVEIDGRVAPVPAEGAEPAGNVVRVAALADSVRLAPRIGRDEALSDELEALLSEHYGAGEAPAAPRPDPAPEVDPARREAIVTKLREAYSLEAEGLLRLKGLLTVVRDREVTHDVTLHSDETQMHRTGVEERLKALDESTSKLRDAVHAAEAAAAGVMARIRSDPAAALRDAEQFEKREAAFYAELEELARGAGDGPTADLAAAHRADEEAMAAKIAGAIPRVDSAV